MATDGLDTLMDAVYEQLRALAVRFMGAERRDHTLEPTALVHEAYLKLAGQEQQQFESRAQFVAIAAGMIRRILIDHARGRGAVKRGGGRHRITLDDGVGLLKDRSVDVLALDEALQKLAGFDGRRAKVVELRFFGGLTNDEAAEVLGISKWTVVDDWELARAWLRRELAKGTEP